MYLNEIDGVQIAIEPTIIDTNSGVIISKTAIFTFNGQSLSIEMPANEVVEEYLDRMYLVVLREKAHLSHYRLVCVTNDKLLYHTSDLPWCSLKEALEWKRRFAVEKELSGLRDEYVFLKIMPYSDTTVDWVKSYMPMRRTNIDQATRRKVYMKCKGHCAYCGKEIDISEMQVDHVESHYRHQGKDEIDNYLPSCRDCNGLKSDYLLEEFRNVLIPNCAKKSHGLGKNTRNDRICKAYHLIRGRKNPRITFYFEKEFKK